MVKHSRDFLIGQERANRSYDLQQEETDKRSIRRWDFKITLAINDSVDVSRWGTDPWTGGTLKPHEIADDDLDYGEEDPNG